MQHPDGLRHVVTVGRPAAHALRTGTHGVVASVHHHAATLRLDSGPVIAVLREPRLLHPWSLAAPLEPASLTVGEAVTGTADMLRVGPASVSLNGARVVALELAARPLALPRALGAGLVARARVALSSLPAALAEAAEDVARGGSPTRLASLVGLGEGLTPSADDLIVGVLAGLDLVCRAAPAAAAARRDLVRSLPADLEARTTRISAQALTAAADGMYAAPLLTLAEALGQQAADDAVEALVTELVSVGHRSGSDVLTGLVTALERALT